MAETESGSKWKKVVIIISIVLIILMLLIFFFVGFDSLRKFFTWLIVGIMILMIIFGLLYVFYSVFIKKEYKDIPASYRKKLQATSKIMKQEMLGSLFLSGDTKHNRINMGKYRYLRIMLPRQVKSLQLDKNQKPVLDKFNQPIYEEQTHGVDVDCFIVMEKGFIAGLFSDPKLILVKPEDHDYSSIFNDVTVRGFNLVPLDSQFFTVDHRNLDVDLSKGVASNYMKEAMYEILSELDRLVKQSMNLDTDFQKQKEKSLEFDIPQINSGQGGQQ